MRAQERHNDQAATTGLAIRNARAARRGPLPRAAALASPSGLTSLQRLAGNTAVTSALEQDQEQHVHGAGCGHDQPVSQDAVVGVLQQSSGAPVDPAIRAKAEQGLGTDLSDVRVHSGLAARRSAAELGARAYTSGRHIVLGDGGHDEHTVLHELVHTWQQQRGPVEGADNGAGIHLSAEGDRHENEAEALAHQLKDVSAPTTDPAARPVSGDSATPAGASGAVPVQRMPRGSRYAPGTYGYDERKRLEARHGSDFRRKDYEDEHVSAVDSTARYSGISRRKNTRHVGELPSYYEDKPSHRIHPGTGSSSVTVGPTGYTGESFRRRQESYLFDDEPGKSVLSNQIEYNTDEWHSTTGTKVGEIADDSFNFMLDSNQRTPFYDEYGDRQPGSSLRPQDQAGAQLTRTTMREGWQSEEQEQSILDRYGATRFDDYPTRGRLGKERSDDFAWSTSSYDMAASGAKLSSYPDVRDRSASPLRIPESSYGDGGYGDGYSYDKLKYLAKTGTSSSYLDDKKPYSYLDDDKPSYSYLDDKKPYSYLDDDKPYSYLDDDDKPSYSFSENYKSSSYLDDDYSSSSYRRSRRYD